MPSGYLRLAEQGAGGAGVAALSIRSGRARNESRFESWFRLHSWGGRSQRACDTFANIWNRDS
jgi:hypothetical protein